MKYMIQIYPFETLQPDFWTLLEVDLGQGQRFPTAQGTKRRRRQQLDVCAIEAITLHTCSAGHRAWVPAGESVLLYGTSC